MLFLITFIAAEHASLRESITDCRAVSAAGDADEIRRVCCSTETIVSRANPAHQFTADCGGLSAAKAGSSGAATRGADSAAPAAAVTDGQADTERARRERSVKRPGRYVYCCIIIQMSYNYLLNII